MNPFLILFFVFSVYISRIWNWNEFGLSLYLLRILPFNHPSRLAIIYILALSVLLLIFRRCRRMRKSNFKINNFHQGKKKWKIKQKKRRSSSVISIFLFLGEKITSSLCCWPEPRELEKIIPFFIFHFLP